MKLWLLKPIDLESDHWDPWYDRCFAIVVRAETEYKARTLAQSVAGPEGQVYNRDTGRYERTDVWMLQAITSCVDLLPEGKPGVIVQDIREA